MDKADKVYFKATKGRIIVMMDAAADFEELKNSLSIKSGQARNFFGDISATIIFRGRNLKAEEEAALVEIIERETNLKVYVAEDTAEIKDKAACSQSSNVVNLNTAANSKKQQSGGFQQPAADIMSKETAGTAIFHKRSLRSGQSIVTAGNVVVLGDVNPGGEITAGGNIVVLGALKGLAHAGAYGNRDAYVAALDLQPVQLRIANMISILAEELTKQKKSGAAVPSYAFIEDEQICIAPLI